MIPGKFFLTLMWHQLFQINLQLPAQTVFGRFMQSLTLYSDSQEVSFTRLNALNWDLKKYFNIHHASLLWKHAKEKYQNISACDPPVTAQQSADGRICDNTETC